MGPVIRWFARTRVVGELPEGPIVLAPNHLTEIDSLVLCASLPRRLTFVAKSEYFARGGAGARLYGNLCRLTGQIPISRAGAESADAALHAATGILRSGGAWAIYPEGTRSPDGRLFRGRTGAMRVALTAWTARATDPRAWRAATDHLMSAIQSLTGQEYVDRYPTAAERAIRDAA